MLSRELVVEVHVAHRSLRVVARPRARRPGHIGSLQTAPAQSAAAQAPCGSAGLKQGGTPTGGGGTGINGQVAAAAAARAAAPDVTVVAEAEVGAAVESDGVYNPCDRIMQGEQQRWGSEQLEGQRQAEEEDMMILEGLLEAPVRADQTTWSLMTSNTTASISVLAASPALLGQVNGTSRGIRTAASADGPGSCSTGSNTDRSSGGGVSRTAAAPLSDAAATNAGSAAGSSGAAGLLVAISLVKMRPADGAASEAWWVRCLEGAPEVEWDAGAGERDYSTMPEEELHRQRRERAQVEAAREEAEEVRRQRT